MSIYVNIEKIKLMKIAMSVVAVDAVPEERIFEKVRRGQCQR